MTDNCRSGEHMTPVYEQAGLLFGILLIWGTLYDFDYLGIDAAKVKQDEESVPKMFQDKTTIKTIEQLQLQMILIGLVAFLALLILIHCAWRCYGDIISAQRPTFVSPNDIYFTPKTNKILARLDNKNGKAD